MVLVGVGSNWGLLILMYRRYLSLNHPEATSVHLLLLFSQSDSLNHYRAAKYSSEAATFILLNDAIKEQESCKGLISMSSVLTKASSLCIPMAHFKRENFAPLLLDETFEAFQFKCLLCSLKLHAISAKHTVLN